MGWRKRNGDGGLHARGELLDARSHGERAAAASGGLVARKGPHRADSRGARRGRWRARGMGSAHAPGSIATSAPLTLDGGVAPEGPSVDVARVPASPAPRIRSDTEGEAGSRPGRREPRCPCPGHLLRRRARLGGDHGGDVAHGRRRPRPRATDADAEPRVVGDSRPGRRNARSLAIVRGPRALFGVVGSELA